MVWKKILSLVIIAVLITGGLAIIGSQSAKAERGEQVHTIDFGVHFDIESAVEEVCEGERDLFLHPIDGPIYQGLPEEWRMELDTWESRTSYKNLMFNPAHEGHGTEAIQDAIDRGWIDDPEDVQWLANDFEGEWTVNPFTHEEIRLAMQYLNRKEIIDELIEGFGDPRYSYMDTESEVWRDHFVEAIVEEYNMSAEGDIELMEQMIEGAMQEIKENVAFGEVRFEEGYWQYRPPEEDWHDIEIKIITRVEDWRNDLGNYIVDILQDLGFHAWVDPTDSATAIPLVFFGEPEPYDNLAYHIYTGGWFSSQAEYYQEDRLSQMYTPWYGLTQTHVEEKRWNYDEEGYTDRVQRLDNISKELYQGQIENKEKYWEKKVEATQLGFEESVRVFLLTEQAFYPYNPNNVRRAVPEAINGYDTYFGPRTMFTDNGKLETGFLYWAGLHGCWNLFGGSEELYVDNQRRMLREYGSWNHPETGIPMEVNVYWSEGRETDPYERKGDIKLDYEWDGDDLIENIEISEKAVDYVAGDRKWLDRNELIAEGYIEDEYAAVKATLDVHEEHVWHDGSNFSLQDVMAAYARNKELGDNTQEPYLESWNLSQSVWWESIHAIEWNEEKGTYTVYGDYTLPIEDKIGDHYSIFPEVHPLTYEGWNHLHGGDKTEYGGIVDQDYNYEPGYGGMWIHQLSLNQNEDLVKVLEAMREDEWIPYYLREETNAPIPINSGELTDQLESLINFIETHNHSFIGTGPFWIEDLDEYTPIVMSLQRHDDYGFPFEGEEAGGVEFPYGYWSAQFEIDEISFDMMEVKPDELKLYEEEETGDVEIFVEGQWVSLYPEPDERALTEEDLEDYTLRLAEFEGGPAVEVDGESLELGRDEISLEKKNNVTQFSAEMNIADVGTGIYFMEFRARAEEDGPWTLITHDVRVEAEEEHTLTLNIHGEGTVEVNGVEKEPDTYTFDPLEEIELAAVSAEEWTFDQWVGDVPSLNQKEKEITLLMDGDKEIEAHFRELEEYELTINIQGEGTTDPEPGTYTYLEGEEVTVEAIPDEGWEFDEWIGDIRSSSVETSFTMDADLEITAVFEIESEPAYFEVEITDYDDEVDEGDTVTVEFTVENTGELEGTQTIVFSVDGDEEDTMEMTIGAGESEDGEFEWEADDAGEYELEIASDDHEDTVAVTVEEDDDIPGFTLSSLLIASFISAIWYQRKIKDKNKR